MVRNKCERTTIRVGTGRGRAVLRADGSVFCFVSFSLTDRHDDDDGSLERDFARGHNHQCNMVGDRRRKLVRLSLSINLLIIK